LKTTAFWPLPRTGKAPKVFAIECRQGDAAATPEERSVIGIDEIDITLGVGEQGFNEQLLVRTLEVWRGQDRGCLLGYFVMMSQAIERFQGPHDLSDHQ